MWSNVHSLHEYPNSHGGAFPHMCFTAASSLNGEDGSILPGELALLLTVMYNRAHQPKVDEDGEEVWPKRYEFEKEKQFPVMMVSFVGPQHGRPFYAYLDDAALIVGQSPLFSFEKRDDAPWDPFTRFFSASQVET